MLSLLMISNFALLWAFVDCLILETPEDVTVYGGEPATLKCRVDIGGVKWLKDGLIIIDEDEDDIIFLQDGSIFFLSTQLSDTGLYNCENIREGVKIMTSRPAALIVIDKGDSEEIPTSTHINDLETKSDFAINAKVINDKIPPLVYIVAMVIVGIMTVIVIAAAILIFKRVIEERREESQMKYKNCEQTLKWHMNPWDGQHTSFSDIKRQCEPIIGPYASVDISEQYYLSRPLNLI